MKTTQMTSNVLVAAMLLSTVSSVFAVEMPAFAKNAWTSTKTFFAPVTYAKGEKEAELAQFNMTDADLKVAQDYIKTRQDEVKTLRDQHVAALKALNDNQAIPANDKATQVVALKEKQAKDFSKLQKSVNNDVSDINWHTGVRGKIYKQYVNHPNVVKYGAMSAVVAAITAAAAVCYRYSLPQRAWNKIKSLFKTEPVLNQIVDKANEMIAAKGKDVENNLQVLVSATETPVAKAIASCKTTSKALIEAVNDFIYKLKMYDTNNNQVNQVALDTAKTNLVAAVNACNAELKTQEEKAAKDKTTSENKPEEVVTPVKPATTTPTVAKSTGIRKSAAGRN